MKKKKTLYIMIPIVVLVWGFVFFQLFSSFFTSVNYAKVEEQKMISIEEVKKDTFLIVANYRDPFLGGKVKLKRQLNSSLQVKKISNKQKPIKTDKPWPMITYNGMIKNNNSNRRVCILRVDGKEFLVKEKDVIRDITILVINKNAVKVRFQKESRTITK